MTVEEHRKRHLENIVGFASEAKRLESLHCSHPVKLLAARPDKRLPLTRSRLDHTIIWLRVSITTNPENLAHAPFRNLGREHLRQQPGDHLAGRKNGLPIGSNRGANAEGVKHGGHHHEQRRLCEVATWADPELERRSVMSAVNRSRGTGNSPSPVAEGYRRGIAHVRPVEPPVWSQEALGHERFGVVVR